MQTQVDFAYAFATPHRLTVALPDLERDLAAKVRPAP
jgi:hypothetical protein